MNIDYLTIKKKDLLTYILLSFFPISIISGNFYINLFYLLFAFNFLLNFKQNKLFINNKINYLLIFFFFGLLITVFFSVNWQNSLPRIIKIIFIFFFLVESQRFIHFNKEKINYIFKIWSIIFIIVFFDVVFEIIFGHNLLGFTSYIPGRIASFFGSELVVGAFFHGFVLYFVAYFFFQFSKKKILITAILLILIIISFLIGERSTFKNILILFFIISVLAIFLNYNKDYKLRYYDQLKKIFQKDGVTYFFSNTQYGAHQITAYKIFKNYPIFGVGIKNFRTESAKKIYEDKNMPSNALRQATHPHQVHFEFLSETGIFGYITFLTFIIGSLIIGIRKYLISKNHYLLSSIIFIATSILPILPSGSFLSTFSSGIFWLNFFVMSSLTLDKFKL
jgi:O-antigen ligase